MAGTVCYSGFVNGHAMIEREGYVVPLIGVPVSSVEQECECCGDVKGIRQVELVGGQFLCVKCRRFWVDIQEVLTVCDKVEW